MMIDVTGVDLKDLAKEAYKLSFQSPFILSSCSYIYDGPLSDTTAEALVNIGRNTIMPLYMGVINGKMCNFIVYEHPDGRRYIENHWPGHSDDQLDKLLNSFNLARGIEYGEEK